MAKHKTAEKAIARKDESTNPLCTVIALCEKVLVGADDTATLIRIVDTIGLPSDKRRKIGDLIEIAGLSLFVGMKKANSRGKHKISMVISDDSGNQTVIGHFEFTAGKLPESGNNVISKVFFPWAGAGLYWIELHSIDKAILAKLPVRLHDNQDHSVFSKESPKDK